MQPLNPTIRNIFSKSTISQLDNASIVQFLHRMVLSYSKNIDKTSDESLLNNHLLPQYHQVSMLNQYNGMLQVEVIRYRRFHHQQHLYDYIEKIIHVD